MMAVQAVTILGSTGSIGKSTLDVIGQHPDRYSVFALTANSQVELLLQQIQAYNPRYAVMASEESAEQLRSNTRQLGLETEILAGVEGLSRVASHVDVDVVMAAIVGAAGLLPTLAGAKAGKKILLANKEALVMTGQLFMDAVRDNGAELLPIDSEHNAVFQCIHGSRSDSLLDLGINKITLTASGGPFRDTPINQLKDVTPDMACAHPNWSMGRKISVDSASMLNKGLELIEACWLFSASPDQVEAVLHPQSIVHALVSYIDGSVLAHLGNPDMRVPIAAAMSWPERISSGVAPLNLVDIAQLDFYQPDLDRFPCLRLSMEAMKAGNLATVVLNAVNEVAVEAFLQRKIRFTDIPIVLEEMLGRAVNRPLDTISAVLEQDQLARIETEKWVVDRSGRL
ncbi:MAG: 1-deoxy-D-xylulose-5-phosphate reductoisomerase [Pseudomonadales bacterium]|nr:1-deoxy-D-xylulose-5-phosphate reductoisomerase [Pseudomonadales bacterium]